MAKYQAIIIGSGQAGNPLAKKLAKAGWKTAIIEKKWVGGTCVNVGCTPTKTMIASGRIAYLAGRSADFGVHTTGVTVNMAEVVKRKNKKVLHSRNSSTKGLLETANLDLIFGDAAFSASKEITVTKEDGTKQVLSAETIFINTGTSPVIPKIPGLDQINYLTSASVMDLEIIPTHLLIIGGSYIALEFGQLYRRLGSEVTILESSEQFLSKEDDDIAAEIKLILQEDGIRILTGSQVSKIAMSGEDISVTLKSGALLHGSHLLVATGREANTKDLQTQEAGILLDDKGFVVVDDKLETNIAGVYALGDCKGGPQFTHISFNDHLIVYKNLVEKAGLSIAGRLPIYCMFTDPELGRVGMTEKQAKENGLNFKVATMPAKNIARAWENDEDRGMLKAIVNADDKKIIGAAMLCAGGGELMSVLEMAMIGGVTYDTIRDAVFAHPTFAEALNNLFSKLD